ncbi:hypothetical protein E4U61_001887 [Claviceps capensis]|nr:hypothetical protein E4U61_001887 [Claviceps capensis]
MASTSWKKRSSFWPVCFAREAVLHGRKIQRFLFALYVGVAQLDKKIFASLFVGLKRAFDGHDIKTDGQGVEDEWETWNSKALEYWKHEALFRSAIEANGRPAATHDAETHIAVESLTWWTWLRVAFAPPTGLS